MTSDAPIELYAFDDTIGDGVILARRRGEPAFVWVQDLGDAYQAAASRGVGIVVTRAVYDELANGGARPGMLRDLSIV